MLILAGVAISAVIDGDGLFRKSREATEVYEKSAEDEGKTIENLMNILEGYMANKHSNKNDIDDSSYGRYYLVEVCDHLGENCASISEIRFYDKDGNKLDYTVLSDMIYDEVTGGAPAWWHPTDSRWDYYNLNDNEVAYSTNVEGGYNVTAFLYDSTPNDGKYARFIIDLQEKKELSNINICIGDSDNRTPGSVSIYNIHNYSPDTYSNNLVQRNDEGLSLIKKLEFNEIVTTPTWYSFIKEKPEEELKRILIEVYDHLGETCAVLSEISFYDKNNTLINYNVMVNDIYDSATGGAPAWWHPTDSRWDYYNLNDNEVAYSTNFEGGYNVTGFLYNSNPNDGKYARFLLELRDLDIRDIKICVGDSDNRTPKAISVYWVNEYSSDTYNNNVVQRSNEGLTLIKTIEFDEIISTPTWYDFL